jgi:hypothetical protein
MATGVEMIARLDFLPCFIPVQEDVSSPGRNDFLELCDPTVERVLLPDGLAPGSLKESFAGVTRLRGKMPGQPEDLETPQAKD